MQFSRLQARCTFTAALTGHTIPMINSALRLSSPSILFFPGLSISLSPSPSLPLPLSAFFFLLFMACLPIILLALEDRLNERMNERMESSDYPHRKPNNSARKKNAVRNRRPATDPIANYLAPIRLGRDRALCRSDVPCYRPRPWITVYRLSILRND